MRVKSLRVKRMNRIARVLVTGHDGFIGSVLVPMLEKAGYEVETFQDPKKALKRFEKKPFDIVITDVRMDDVERTNRVAELKAQIAASCR